MSVNVKELVELLVESGKFDKATATKKVKAAVAAVTKALPGAEDETIEKLVRRKIQKAVTVPASDKFEGICVAYSEKQDANRFSKDKALKLYEDDPMRAVQDGFVKVQGEKVIPLDNRRYIDNAQTMENRMYGKPLPTRMQREVFFIIDKDGENVLTRAYGDVDPEVGGKYEIYGRMTGAGNITIAKGAGIRPNGKVDDFWECVYETASASEFAVGIEDIADIAKNRLAIINGVVRYSGETRNGAMLIVGEDDSEASIAAFAFAGVTADTMMCCEPETEVIVIGRVLETEDRDNPGEMRKAISAIGVIPNPMSMKAVDALRDIDELFMN